VIHHSSGDRLDLAERFMAEGRALAKVSHPNVVAIYDFGRTDEGHLYCVMEYLAGRPLSALLAERGPLNQVELLPYLEQLCLGLSAVHELGIAHRDLKPSNVVVTDEQPPKIKLVDLGLAKSYSTEMACVGLTQSGVFFGTPLFMAPEQTKGKDAVISP
jgi:serine/threonine-protein kinase